MFACLCTSCLFDYLFALRPSIIPSCVYLPDALSIVSLFFHYLPDALSIFVIVLSLSARCFSIVSLFFHFAFGCFF